jgi:hypothetical protein
LGFWVILVWVTRVGLGAGAAAGVAGVGAGVEVFTRLGLALDITRLII